MIVQDSFITCCHEAQQIQNVTVSESAQLCELQWPFSLGEATTRFQQMFAASCVYSTQFCIFKHQQMHRKTLLSVVVLTQCFCLHLDCELTKKKKKSICCKTSCMADHYQISGFNWLSHESNFEIQVFRLATMILCA